MFLAVKKLRVATLVIGLPGLWVNASLHPTVLSIPLLIATVLFLSRYELLRAETTIAREFILVNGLAPTIKLQVDNVVWATTVTNLSALCLIIITFSSLVMTTVCLTDNLFIVGLISLGHLCTITLMSICALDSIFYDLEV